MIPSRIEVLNGLTKHYVEVSKQVDPDFSPNEDSWSFGEILKHLITVNESYFETFDRLLAGKYTQPFFGRFRWIPQFIGKEILKATDLSNPKKVTTFQVWEPGPYTASTITSEFENHQERLIEYLLRMEKSGLFKTDPVIRSPANKSIIYGLNTAIDIIIAHESRHLLQSKNLVK